MTPAKRFHILAPYLLLLFLIRTGLWFIPIHRLRHCLTTLAKFHPKSAHPPDPECAIGNIATAGRLLPGTGCLTQALAAQFILNRYQVRTILRIGFSATEKTAHAWLEFPEKHRDTKGNSQWQTLPLTFLKSNPIARLFHD